MVEPEQFATVPVVFNEGFFPDSGGRWIELYNDSDSSVDLAGFHVTDDRQLLAKTALPAGTTIAPRGWLAFTDVELGLNFSLSSPEPRDRVWVALVNRAGTRVIDAYSFKPTMADKSVARMPDGDEDTAPAADPTPGAANQVTVNTDIVINEIMYHPVRGGSFDEFVELYNRGAGPVDVVEEQAVDSVIPRGRPESALATRRHDNEFRRRIA